MNNIIPFAPAAAAEQLPDLGSFASEPKYAYLWDRCVYKLLYNPEKYVAGMGELLAQHGVGKDSAILDTCAGSGFPALDMAAQGYTHISCADASDDQIELFEKKAAAHGLDIASVKATWEELPVHFEPESFNALICKGSVWYAAGGWNEDFVPNKEATMAALKKTLEIFYSLLKKGGVLYIDKFKDTEVNHKDTVGTFSIAGKKKELIFWAERDRVNNIRRAKMITKDVESGEETGLPNITYDLKEEELVELLREVGFTVSIPHMPEEKFFSNWIAVKE